MSDPSGASTAIRYPVRPQLLPARELQEGRYAVRFARNEAELDEVLSLRYEVFNQELGEGLEASHATGRDRDEFDAVCHHLVVVNRDTRAVVGTYRLQTSEMARRYRGFYSSTLFDLDGLPPAVIQDGVEIGRACVARSHRSTQVLFLLWRGLALYVAANRKRYLFGCSSLTSQDPLEGRAFYEYLERSGHLHPDLEIQPRAGFACWDPGRPPDAAGREIKVPPLFRIYLRHGAKACGPPALDRQFGTVDFLVLFDVDAMPQRMFKTFFD